MPKKKASGLITDQEMAFARLVLSGTNDREAAQAVGLNPDTAASTKSKARVRAYMLELLAAEQQQLAAQEVEGPRRPNLSNRERVLNRLMEIANTSPEVTRGSITAQVKALSMIAAMGGLIPDRLAGSSSPIGPSQVYVASWYARQQEKTIAPEPIPALIQEDDELGAAVEPALREFLRKCGIDPDN